MNLVIKHIRQLATPLGYGPVRGEAMSRIHEMEDVDIWIQSGIILKILPTNTKNPPWERYASIDASDMVATPGITDPHTHIPFYGYRYDEFYQRAQGKSYMEIMQAGGGILNSTHQVRKATVDRMVDFNIPFTDRMLRNGVTFFEGKSGYGLNTTNELKQLYALQRIDEQIPHKVSMTFLGAHALPAEYKSADGYIDMLIHDMLPEVFARFQRRLSADIFCEEGVFNVDQSRRYLERAKELGFDLKLHAEEMVFLGGSILGCELGALSVDHLICINDEGIKALSQSQTVATLLPGTSFFLKKPFAPARRLIDGGAAVALASDFNPGSCTLISPSIVAHLAANHLQMSPEEILTAMTLNASAALGCAKEYGSIEEGKKAHIVLWDLPDYSAMGYLPGHDRAQVVVVEDQAFHIQDRLFRLTDQ